MFEVNAGSYIRYGNDIKFLGMMLPKTLPASMTKELAELTYKKAIEIVPVRTGALRSSGRIVKGAGGKSHGVRFGNLKVPYAQVVEYGRFAFAPFPPKPYLRPATMYAQKMAPRIAKKHMKKQLQKLPKVVL